jgi:hypothetical protein
MGKRQRIIIAGSRSIEGDDFELFDRLVALVTVAEKIKIISGGARGIDQAGERWAERYGVPCKQFIPDWDTLGRKAGLLRNRDMAEYAAKGPKGGSLLLIWDGESRGSMSMMREARRAGLPNIVQLIVQRP